jgi:alanine racemase
MTQEHLRPTWCEVDLDAIAWNFATLRHMIGPRVRVFASLKRNANGCGSAAVARLLDRLGAAAVGFGNIDDALAARRAGARLPILLYPNCLPDAAAAVAEHDLALSLSTREDVEAWSAAVPAGQHIQAFLKLDGGGLRAGALPREAVSVARAIEASNCLTLAGAYGHPMATYGDSEATFTSAQLAETLKVFEALEQAGVRLPVRMVASSAIVLAYPEMDLDAVDPGRILFGSDFPAVPERVRPWRPAIVGLKSRLVMRKRLEKLDGIALAPFFPVKPDMVLGLIPYGWGDGYPRKLPKGASALIRGRRVPLLGPPHSELMRVDLTDVPDAALGDEVVLLGRSGDLEITPAEIAPQWGLSLAEFHAAIPGHIPRVYLRGGVVTGLEAI